MNLPLSAYIEFTLKTFRCKDLSPTQKENVAEQREISESTWIEGLPQVINNEKLSNFAASVWIPSYFTRS